MSLTDRDLDHATDPASRLIGPSEIMTAQHAASSPSDPHGADTLARPVALDHLPDELELSVVIPCLNEADTLASRKRSGRLAKTTSLGKLSSPTTAAPTVRSTSRRDSVRE
jgi:hypothetical protein